MAEPLIDHVDGIVHEPTQTQGRGVSLTLAAVFQVVDPGRVDFGGDELVEANLEPVETQFREPEDDYAWWNLDRGQYLIAHNESLAGTGDREFILQTREAVRSRGAFHPTLRVTDLDLVPLSVGGAGIRLKENARISTLLDRG